MHGRAYVRGGGVDAVHRVWLVFLIFLTECLVYRFFSVCLTDEDVEKAWFVFREKKETGFNLHLGPRVTTKFKMDFTKRP